MPVTPQMNLQLPTVLSTAGPSYANQVNAALTQLDGHTHAPGQGAPVVAAGLNINADVSWRGNNLLAAKTLGFTSQASVPGAGQYAPSVYALNGELAYRNSAGVDVTLTNGGIVQATGGFKGDYAASGASATYTQASSSYALLNPNSTPSTLNVGSLVTSAAASVGTTLAVAGNATLSGTLGVTGATTLAGLNAGAITGSAGLTLSSGSLTATTGNITATAGSVSCVALNASGPVTLSTTGTVDMSTATSVKVTSGATFGSGGSLTVASTSMTSTLNVASTVTLGVASNLVNNGPSSFKNILGPFYFGPATAMTAAQTTQTLLATGGFNSAIYPYTTPTAGSVVGITGWALTSAASTITLTLAKNGASTGLSASVAASTTSANMRNTATKGTYALAAGDNVRVDITSSAAVSVSCVAWLVLELAP